MERLKVGQIGIGHNHGEGKMLAVRKFPELFEVVGYAESDERWIAERGNFECYRDLPRMSEDDLIEKCDIIIVETDIWNLTKTAQKCIDAGKHVHLDKPASGTIQEFEQLINTAKAKGLTLQLGYMYRYNYAICKCMEMIKSGELGEIYQIDAEMSTYHLDEYRAWLKNFRGGSMYIFGSHLIDLVVSILGVPKNIVSFIKQTGHNGVYSDDNNTAILEYDRAIARITNLSVEVNGWGMRRFAVMGSRGTVEIKPIELNVEMTKSDLSIVEKLCGPDKDRMHYSDLKEKIEVKDVPTLSRYDEMMKDLYLSAKGEKENPYGYEHELTVQKVLDKVVGGVSCNGEATD